jgi:hypothetical protein
LQPFYFSTDGFRLVVPLVDKFSRCFSAGNSGLLVVGQISLAPSDLARITWGADHAVYLSLT